MAIVRTNKGWGHFFIRALYMERKNVERFFIHVEVVTCVEFNNLLTIKEKCCQINKGMKIK
jgi:hypothetical protein